LSFPFNPAPTSLSLSPHSQR